MATRRPSARVLTGAGMVAVLAAACGGSAAAPAPSGAPVSLQIAYSEPVADDLPLWIGVEAGIFKQHGLDVTTQQITSTQSVAALLSSQVDMALVGGPETLSAAAGGGDLKIVAVATPVYPYVFYAGPSITTAVQLKGGKIAITRPGATLDIAVRVALDRMGLRPDSDVTLIATGSVPNVTAALLSGQVQGSVSHPPDSLQLEQKGFNRLYDLARQKIPYDSVGLTARGAWVAANKDVVQRFVDGLVEAIQRERKDKPFSVSVLQKYLKLSDQQLLGQTYDFYAGEVVQPLPYPTAAMFKDAQRVLGASNARVAAYDVSKMLDASFLRSAASRGLGR